jgi:hypothetical protein
MLEKGLIEGVDRDFIGAQTIHPTKLTWDGHDFLDSVRDPEIWNKTKDGMKAAGGFTFELLRDLAKGFIRTQIKKHTDIEI